MIALPTPEFELQNFVLNLTTCNEKSRLLDIQPTKNGNKSKGQPPGTKPEKIFKPCINRPLRIRAYMDSLDMDNLLLTNQFKFSINIVKIIMKTKDRITYNPIFAPPPS